MDYIGADYGPSVKDDFGNQHFTPVPKRNYERRVGCPYIKKEA